MNWSQQLFDSVQSNNLPKVREALENGADIYHISLKENALTYAIKNDLTEIAEVIIDHGVDLNARNSNNVTPLHVAVEERKNEIAHRLLDAGADVNAASQSGANPLYRAAQFGNEEIAVRLIEMGADIHAAVRGRTPLIESIRSGSAGIAEALLEAGADLNVIDQTSATALDIARHLGDAASVKMLLEHGADPYKADAHGLQTLHRTVVDGKIDVVRVLCESHAG